MWTMKLKYIDGHLQIDNEAQPLRQLLASAMKSFLQLVASNNSLESTTRMVRLQPLLSMLREALELWRWDSLKNA